MANVFDQFDEPKDAGNVFDQFDERQQEAEPALPAEAAPVAEPNNAPEQGESSLLDYVPAYSILGDMLGESAAILAVDEDPAKALQNFIENSPPAVAAETIASFLSGTAGAVGGGLEGIRQTLMNGAESGAEAVEGVSSALTYAPRAEGTQKALGQLEPVGKAWAALQRLTGRGMERLATAAGAEPGSTVAGSAYAAGSALPDALAMLLPGSKLAKQRKPAAAQPEAAGVEDLSKGIEAASGDSLLGGSGRKAVTQAMAEQVRPQQELVKAFDEVGIPAESVPPEVLSSNQAFRQVAGTARSVPASPLAIRYRTFLDDLSAKADEISKAADADDMASVNVSVTESLEGDIRRARNIENDLYAKIDKGVAPFTAVDTSPLTSKLMARLKEVGGDYGELTAMERRLFPRFIERSKGPDGQPVFTPKPKTWAALSGLRKELNAARSGKGGFGDAASYELDSYANTVSGAMRSAADELGIGEQYAAAMQATGAKKAAQEAAEKLLGEKLDKSFTAVMGTRMGNLAKGRVQEFNDAVAALPEAQRQSAVTSMVFDKLINRQNLNGRVDIAGFNKWYNQLRANPQAKFALYQHLAPDVRTHIDNLGKAVSAVKRANEDMVATGRLLAADEKFKLGESILRKIAADIPVVKSFMGGTGAAVAEATGLAAKQGKRLESAASDLLGSAEFQRHTANMVGDVREGVLRASERSLQDSIGWRRYYAALPKEKREAITRVGVTNWLGHLPEEDQQMIDNEAKTATN